MLLRALSCSAALGAAFAVGAQAATLEMTSDKSVYQLGETITLTLTATIPGGPADGSNSAKQMFVVVGHDLGRVTALGVSGPVAPEDGDVPDRFTSQAGAAPWLRGGNEGTCDWTPIGSRVDQCLAWDEIPPGLPSASPTQLDAGIERSILQYVAAAPGYADFRFAQLITGFEGLVTNADLFDPAPTGITVRIVPEPAVAGLLGAGLVALALRRRSGVQGPSEPHSRP